jgi:steroid delta-isomerase-like uncharacterized protein
MSSANKLIVGRKMDELISSGNLAVLDEVFDEEVVSYDASEPEPIRGRDAYRAGVEEVLAAFPSRHIRIEDQISEGDRVVTRWTFTGRHDGELLGIPATGVDVEFNGIDIHRIRNGRIVEEWSSWDTLGLMRQLGAVAEMGPVA